MPDLLLYKLVYRTRYTVLISGWLCLCFLVQPVHQAYADTTADQASTTLSVNPENSTEPQIEDHEPQPPEPVPAAPTTSETTTDQSTDSTLSDEGGGATTSTESSASTPTTTLEADLVHQEPAATATSSPRATTTSKTETAPTELSTDTASSSEPATATSTPTVDTATTTTASSSGQAHSRDTVDPNSESSPSATQSSDTDVATGTTAQPPPDTQDDTPLVSSDTSPAARTATETQPTTATDPAPLVSVVESDTHFAFSRDECTSIEDGSFYCQPRTDDASSPDRLLADQDADGDMEIYLLQSGERRQITDNVVDDAAPYYDPVSETIVWHRMINDRYQIVSYDTVTGDEVVLTNNRVNDMEPARHDDRIVWQRWVEDNWEIMLWQDGEITQITNSPEHDLAPHVRGPLVIWNSRYSDGSQALKTYDVEKQTITTIGDESGVSVANPRMVVMYEAMYENGDIVTKGFDIISGEVVPLHSLPRELPDELPDSDSTGETRALIQNKPTLKQSDKSSEADPNGSGDANTASRTDGVLDLRNASTTEGYDSASTTASTNPRAVVPDLVLPATSTTASSSQNTAE